MDANQIAGHWIHSHEEDKDGDQLFRLKGYNFPPARGREGMELKLDGAALIHGVGAADQGSVKPGSWRLNEVDRPILELSDPDGNTRKFTVIEAGTDVLRMHPLADEQP